jgi:hypothetical protein
MHHRFMRCGRRAFKAKPCLGLVYFTERAMTTTLNMNPTAITASSITHVGTPRPGFHEEWVTHKVYFHKFARLSATRDVFVKSPKFTLLGNQWRLEIYPGGSANADEGMVSLGLWNMSNRAIEIDFGFSVNDGNGKQVVYERSDGPNNFAPVGGLNSGDGWNSFAKRSKLLNSLINGTLVIEVCVRPLVPEKSSPSPFIPENPSACKIIQGLFLDEKSADIAFEVKMGERPKDNAPKIAMASPETFPAHRLILVNCSSILADLCASGGGENRTTPIEISDVSPDIFRLLLSYIYGMPISNNDMTIHAKEIINAADRFGITGLKLEAEAYLVTNTTFGVENVKDLLIYADSMNCALLKEVAMDYMLENKDVVLENIRFDDAPGSLVNDVFAAIARAETKRGDNIEISDQGSSNNNSASHFNSMRISELRQKVHEKGLDVDGSREMLIAALKGKEE